MSNVNDYITVNVSKEEIRVRLKKMLNSEHSDLVSEVIIENLSVTEVGLKKLFKAFSGIEETYKYKVGEAVMLKQTASYSWRLNVDMMQDAGMIRQEYIKAKILGVVPTSKMPYKIGYSYIDSTGLIVEETGCTAEEENLQPYDHFPLDL